MAFIDQLTDISINHTSFTKHCSYNDFGVMNLTSRVNTRVDTNGHFFWALELSTLSGLWSFKFLKLNEPFHEIMVLFVLPKLIL